MRNANAKQPSVNSSTGQAWTDAEKAAYAASQQVAFENLMQYFRGKGPKSRVSFEAKVLSFSDEPYELTETIEGVTATRLVSDVKVELVQPGLEGIRFVMNVTDKPNTIQNTGSALNHLYVAATHKQVREYGPFSWDPQDIIHTSAGGKGDFIFAVIQKGNPRTDGLRGGFWSALKDFEEKLPEEAPTPVASAKSTATTVSLAAPVKAPTKRQAKAPDPEVPADDVDDVPF